MDIHVSSLMTILDMVMCIWWKSKSSESFKEHRNTVEIQINKKSINILWWHLGGEYFIQDFQDYLKKIGFPHNGYLLEHHDIIEFLKGEIIPY
jgi:hypothetical protein